MSDKFLFDAIKEEFGRELRTDVNYPFVNLNKKQLYKNLSEMDDKELLVDEKTKTLNTDFYGK